MMWIAIVALLIGLVALGYAWKLQQELGSVTRRLDRYNKALFDANDELRQLREELTATTSALRVELKRANGALTFEPSMTVREAQLIHPQVQEVMAGLHLGGCNSCAVEPDETLAEVCAEHGRDVNTLIQNLNSLLGTANGQRGVAVQPVKLPNVALDF